MSATAKDLRIIGASGGTREYRVAASATRYYAGEPANSLATYSSGVANVNTVVVLTDAKPVITTDNFVGIFAQNAPGTGTLAAHKTHVSIPIPNVSLIRGKAKVSTNIDTDAELLGVLWDVVLFDLTTGLYTIDETAAADTSMLRIENGNIQRGTLDVSVDVRAFRGDVT